MGPSRTDGADLIRQAEIVRLSAIAAFEAGFPDEAASFSEELLTMTATTSDGMPSGATRIDDDIYVANDLLGKLALERGELEAAEAYLTSASEGRTSVRMRWWPDLDLANGLIAQGRSKAVLIYLSRLRQTWRFGQRLVDDWMEILDRDELRPLRVEEIRKYDRNYLRTTLRMIRNRPL
jgi:hypothetical protein